MSRLGVDEGTKVMYLDKRFSTIEFMHLAVPAEHLLLFLRGGNLPFPRKLRESSGEFLFLLECN